MADLSLTFADGGDAYTFPAVQTVRDTFGDAVPRTTRLPLVHGGFDMLGVDDAPSEVGQVIITCELVAATRSAMQAKIDAIRALRWLGKRKLYFQPQGTANARWCWARVNNVTVNRAPAEHTDLRQPVTVNFQVSDPVWRETEENEAISASGTLTDETITNSGNAPALARVVVTCDAGETAENPTVQRIVSSVAVDEMAYAGVLVASDALVMDAQGKTVELNDEGVYDDFAFEHPDWFRLLPGNNTVRVLLENETDEATVTVYWSDTYR